MILSVAPSRSSRSSAVRADRRLASRSGNPVAVGPHEIDMTGQRLGGIHERFAQRVTGRDAARKVREADAVARAGVLVDQCDVAGWSSLSLRQTCLTIDRPDRLGMQVLLRVRDGDLARFGRVLEVMVAPGHAHGIPAVRNQITDDITQVLAQVALPATPQSQNAAWTSPAAKSDGQPCRNLVAPDAIRADGETT